MGVLNIVGIATAITFFVILLWGLDEGFLDDDYAERKKNRGEWK